VDLIPHIALLIFGFLAVLATVAFLVIDMLGRVDYLKQHAPWLEKILERKSALGVLLLVAVLLLCGDAYELITKEVPNVPAAPIIRIMAPTPPTIAVQTAIPGRSTATVYAYRNEMSVSQVANLTEHFAGAIRQAKPIVFLITFSPGNEKFREDVYALILAACNAVRGGTENPCVIERPPDPKLEIDTGIPTPTHSGLVVHASESIENSGQYIASQYVLGSCYNAVYSDSKIPDSIKKAARLGPNDRNFVWIELAPGSPWNIGPGC
jgi:hypothetical protein